MTMAASPPGPASGLSSHAAAERLASFGPNALAESAGPSWWRQLLGQFRSPLVYVLLAAFLVQLVAWAGWRGGPPWEGVAIAAILLLNAGLGAWQERKAESALAELRRLAAPRAWVVRDGRLARIPSAELVPGDLVRVEAGDRAPADLQCRAPADVLVDESILTGESLPVEKRDGDALYSGTLVARGSTYGGVTATGAASAMGRLVGALAGIRAERTPLERRLDVFGREVAGAVFVLAAGIVLAGVAVEGSAQFGRIFLLAVALAVAAVPEGLPAILTLALTFGVQRMARRKAIVRRLAAVEALGSVTVIATDKTGTLTENRLEVRRVDSPDLPRALRAMALAGGGDAGAADPLEQALVRYAAERAADRGPSPAPISGRAFDSVARFTRVTIAEGDGASSYFKGAPEVMLERSALSPAARAHWTAEIERAAAEGYRVLGLAWGGGDAEHELRWLGLVSLWDPPRPEVRAALAAARRAGIRVLMITGDHGAIARAVVRALGLEGDHVVTGAAFEAMSADGRQGAVKRASIFARVSPTHKLAIVEALKEAGEVVAVTGDGVNDAPALKRADVGIAMGQRGSDVAREVADLVLLDDNFATITGAIEEGRAIYRNIETVIRFLFSTNLSEVALVVLGSLVAMALGLRDAAGHLLVPLTAVQLLWINLITDGVPALALTLDRHPDQMRQRPRSVQALLNRSWLRYVLVTGLATAMLGLGLFAALSGLGLDIGVARGAVFAFLAATQLLQVYAVRRARPAARPNRLLNLAVALGLVLQVAVSTVPFLRGPLETVAITPVAWLAVAGAAVLAWMVAEAVASAFRGLTPVSGPVHATDASVRV